MSFTYRAGPDFTPLLSTPPEIWEHWDELRISNAQQAEPHWAVEAISTSDAELNTLVEVLDSDGVPLSGVQVVFLVDSEAEYLRRPQELTWDAPLPANGRILQTVSGVAEWIGGVETVFVLTEHPSAIVHNAFWKPLRPGQVSNAKEHHTLRITFRFKS